MTKERVLVVPTKKLYQKGKWNGFKQQQLDWYRQLVDHHGGFHSRNQMERDSNYKQVIPQIIFTYRNKVFFHRVHKSGSEPRLHNMYPIFLGGHVNPIDQQTNKDLLDAAAEREFYEEVDYSGSLIRQNFVGLVNQLSGTVNQAHVGYVFLFEGDSPQITAREEEVEKIGLLTIEELKPYIDRMTYWSRLVYPYLEKLI